ncbi:MAG: pitrilysin family protein [Thermaerobacter sp.]|nr:pitrilysin family protein [Thermaerobacter sp.]
MVEEIKLPNGMTLVAEQTPWQQGVSLGLFVRGAVVDEPAGQEGIAHLLEHLVFRGTEHYPSAALSAAIEEGGGELNAYTTKEYTCLWGRTLPEGFARYMEILAELFARPLLRARDLAREVQVIEEEHALWLDNPEEFTCDLLEEEIFAHSPLGRRVLGEPAALRDLRASDVRAFHAAAWRLDRTVLAVAGPISLQEVAQLASGAFTAPGAVRKARSVHAARTEEPLQPPQISQVHLAVGGPGLPFGDPGLAAQELLIQEFGGGPNSRLFQRLREEEALSYAVYSYETAYAGAGMWGAYADLPPDGLNAGLQAIVEEARALRAARLSERHVSAMRRAARGALLLALDSPFARVERYALQILLSGQAEGVESELERLAAVDAKAVRSQAQRVLDTQTWRAVALLPDGRVLRGSIDELSLAEVGA